MGTRDRRGDELIDRVLHGGADDAELVTALLTELQRGFPIAELKRLLTASAEETVYVGAWLAAEMGEAGREIFNDVVPLLRHPLDRVRFYAVDFVSTNVRPTDWQTAASVMHLIDDPASAVRYAAIKFLFDVPEDVLQGVRDGSLEDNSTQASGLSLLIDAVGARDTDRVQTALTDANPTLRRFAVAAAARLSPYDRSVLMNAATVEDPDVREFATNTMRRIGARQRRLH